MSLTQVCQAKSSNKVAILLATYNGLNWLKYQLDSLLSQINVDLTIFISDDCSSDGTFEYLNKLALKDSRIILLPSKERLGSAGKNFYRLITDVNILDFDYVAFSDQDDIWNLDKLSTHIQLIKQLNVEAISSNVLAFSHPEYTKLIVKSQPQKKYDFLFESAGPGCTFMMTPWLVNEVKHQLLSNKVAQEVTMHDWLTYAICRAHNKRWLIHTTPSMLYRQHQNNVIGANTGFKAAWSRLKKINSGWYRHEVSLISKVVTSISEDPNVLKFQKIIQSKSFLDQLRLITFALQGRRKLSDRCFLTLSILFLIF